MKGVFFIWQWTWNLLNCHHLHIANRMGWQSCNWFNNFWKCQLNIEKTFTWNNLLLLELSNSLMFCHDVINIVCWKYCFPKIVTCWSCYCLLEEILLLNYLLEMMFSNNCYLLKELFSSCYCWWLDVVAVTAIVIDATTTNTIIVGL